jgi:hypothetical protein
MCVCCDLVAPVHCTSPGSNCWRFASSFIVRYCCWGRPYSCFLGGQWGPTSCWCHCKHAWEYHLRGSLSTIVWDVQLHDTGFENPQACPMIEINYKLPVRTVWINATRTIIQNSCSLDIFAAAGGDMILIAIWLSFETIRPVGPRLPYDSK